MQACPSRYDIVLTTNSGYPLDQNLYQAVKGMSAAALVVKEGGTIISASECRDGIPNHGNYRQILQMRSTPTGLLDMINAPGFSMFDQWQVQVQAKIQLNARIFVKSDYLTDRQLEEAHFIPCHDIAETIEKLMEEYGPDATICVLPQGPQTVPYVAATALVS
jgi:nickel-dependent lactate racemase